MNVKLTALVIGIAAGALGVLARTGTSEGLRLQAASDDPYLDSDGDLLPDQLEWVTLSSPSSADSDGDGRDDFLEVVQHTATYQGTSTQPVDNEMRVLLSTATSGRSRDIWMHCLFRFASGRLDLDWFAPYITNGQVAVPMLSIIGRTPMNLVVRTVPNQGLYASLSLRLTTEAEFRRYLPCTVTALASIGGRRISTGMYAFDSGTEISTLLPRGVDINRRSFLVQSLRSLDVNSQSQFFRGNKVCELGLSVLASTPGGSLCEVQSAACEPANGLRCSTSCSSAVGSEIFVPAGLAATTGG